MHLIAPSEPELAIGSAFQMTGVHLFVALVAPVLHGLGHAVLDDVLHTAIAELNYSLEAVSRNIDAILANIESATRNASEFSRQIRENPGRLLGGAAPRDSGVSRE